MRRLRLLLLLVAFRAYAAGHDVTPMAIGPMPNATASPAVASNGQTFITVWTMPAAVGSHLFAARADSNAKPIESNAIWLATEDGLAGTPQLVPFGSNFVAAWRSGLVVLAIEITPELQVIRRFTLPAFGEIAWNGESFAIVSIEKSYGTVTFADRNGTQLKQISINSYGNQRARVAAAGDGFVVVSFVSGVAATGINSAGEVAWTRELMPRTLYPQPQTTIASLASNGAETLVTWIVGNSDVHPDTLEYAILRRDGASAKRATLIPELSVMDIQASLSSVWHRDRFILGALVAEPPPPLQYALVVYQIAGSGDLAYPEALNYGVDSLPAFASNGTALYAAAAEKFDSPRTSETFGGWITGGSFTLDNTWVRNLLSRGARRQLGPRVAAGTSTAMALWVDQTLGESLLASASLRFEGVAGAIEASMPMRSFDRYDIAFGGGIYLAAFVQDNRLYGRRYTAAAVAIDNQPFLISSDVIAQFDVSIAFDGQRFLVAWTRPNAIAAAFVTPDAQVSEARTLVVASQSLATPIRPRVAWSGREFLVVFEGLGSTYPWMFGPTPNTRALRLSQDGSVIGVPAVVTQIAVGQSIASDGRGFLVVSDSYSGDTFARYVRIENDTLVVGPAISLGPASRSSVTFNGVDFVVSSKQTLFHQQWLQLAHVSPTGFISQRRAVEVARSPGADRPAIATLPSGESIVLVSEEPLIIGIARVRSYLESEIPLLPAVPAAPIIKSATITASTATVEWEPSEGATGYAIYTSTGSTFFSLGPIGPFPTHRAVVYHSGAKTMVIRVVAYNAAGTSAPADVAVAHPPRRRAVGR